MQTKELHNVSAPLPAAARPEVHPGDIANGELRAALHATADMIADYLQGVGEDRVVPQMKPGALRATLPPAPPATGEALGDILADVPRLIMRNTTHWNHPGFMAYFPVTGSGPGIVGEALAAALNVNAMLWRTGPAATELEAHATDWLRQMLQLPADYTGHINDTASIGSMIALAAARERCGLDIRRKGLAGRNLPPLTVYCSDQAHSSIDKAVVTLGLGLENLRRIESDDAYRLRIDRLEAAIAADKAAGRKPIAIVGTFGTTSTTSMDPLRALAEIAQREQLWFHVDGAYALSACICPELRPLAGGVELADSIVTNPHKWLFVPVDCSVLFVRDPELLRRAFSIIPDYLTTTETNVTNLMDYGVQLGRRFRSLKLWMVLRAFGVQGLQERIRYHCGLAQDFAAWVRTQPHLELSAPTPFATVCFRALPPGTPEQQDTFNERLVAAVNAAGPVFISHTRLRGRFTLRVSIGNLRTTPQHVATVQRLVTEAYERLMAE